MPRITRLQLQPGRANRVAVELDGEPAFSLALELAGALVNGQSLDPAAIAGLRDEDDYRSALARALTCLNARARTRHEVERRLAEQGAPPAAVARVVARLEALSLLDDAAYAARFVEHQLATRPQGARALRHKLRERGVDESLIAAATDGLDEAAVARRLALDRVPRLAGLDRAAFERRLGGLLARRGFAFDAIRPAVEAAWRAARGGD